MKKIITIGPWSVGVERSSRRYPMSWSYQRGGGVRWSWREWSVAHIGSVVLYRSRAVRRGD